MCVVSQPAPGFTLKAVSATAEESFEVSLADFTGQWLVLLFYPRDFTFICPTELTSFSARHGEFQRRNSRLLGVSVDTCEMHREWLRTPPAQGGIGPLRFPLASDPVGEVAAKYGVWQAEKQVSLRGLFLIDPQGTLQYAVVHNLSVGRNVDEALRVLDALQNGGLCPANWTTADGTIDLQGALQPGRVLGHYRIRQLLGHGTFGVVFAALDLRLDRVVAIKVLKHYSSDSRQCILREARAAAALNHPNICRVLTVEEADGLPLIVMEYLDGYDLKRLAALELSADQRIEIARGIALGLAAAHARQVVHGDLKPGNILISHDLVPRILDFGMARSAASTTDTSTNSTMSGVTGPTPQGSQLDATMPLATSAVAPQASAPTSMGTPAYMSPEQWNGRAATTASDIYALGLILAEFFTGRRALGGDTLAQLLARVQNPQFASQVVQHVEARLQGLLADMLAMAPESRPAAAEVASRLERLASNQSQPEARARKFDLDSH